MPSPPVRTPNRPSIPEKVAIIPGASRGLGRVLAAFWAGQGYALVLTSRGKVELAGATDEVRENGSQIVSIPGDVSDPDHRARLLRAAEDLGRIDVLVNNASDLGESPLPPLARAKREDLLRVYDVNTLAPLALIQQALPLLV